VVIATKVYGRTRPGPNGSGLSLKAIFAEIDNDLRQLGMDYGRPWVRAASCVLIPHLASIRDPHAVSGTIGPVKAALVAEACTCRAGQSVDEWRSQALEDP
jgi:hypothetical protein